MLHAPSSSEYSEWTCRCATVGVLIGVETIGVAADASRHRDPRPRNLRGSEWLGMYSTLGVRRVVNACGIYTDLGGSVLSPSVWAAAAARRTRSWASMDELLDAPARGSAALCGAPAARVVPGASAGIALASARASRRGDGRRRARRCRGSTPSC